MITMNEIVQKFNVGEGHKGKTPKIDLKTSLQCRVTIKGNTTDANDFINALSAQGYSDQAIYNIFLKVYISMGKPKLEVV